jgi:hypothetical protein
VAQTIKESVRNFSLVFIWHRPWQSSSAIFPLKRCQSTDAAGPFETRSTSLNHRCGFAVGWKNRDTLIPGPSPFKGEGSKQLQVGGWFADLPFGRRKRHPQKIHPSSLRALRDLRGKKIIRKALEKTSDVFVVKNNQQE